MEKNYSLVIEAFETSCGDPIFMSRGHHDRDVFRAAVISFTGWDEDEIREEDIDQKYWRELNHGGFMPCDSDYPGAFPVTIISS
jgi:hypothetical protein